MVHLVPRGIRGLGEVLLGRVVRNNNALIKGIAG
jgi:hypothetical protein